MRVFRTSVAWRYVAVAGLFLSIRLCIAQSTNASISGVVVDPQGASIPDAKIAVTNVATGNQRQTTSSANGSYILPDLPIGDYKVTTSATGFKSLVIPSVTLHVNQAASLNLKLDIGAVSEQVVVTTELPQLNTESASVGQVVQEKSIESQPLNGRAFWQLVALVPGASYTPGTGVAAPGGGAIRSSAVNVQISGAGPVWTGWNIDGADVTEYESGGTNVQPEVDALQEFKVLAANMPAEYGHTPNVVSVTMRSGTNQFHGTAYEFIRNDVIDAHNYFSRSSKNPLKRNQFGGQIGGPILRNKLFFFTDIEQSLQSQGTVFDDIVPTDNQRTGDFAGSTALKNPATGLPFPDNQVGPISPQAAFFLQFLPTTSQATFSANQILNTTKADMKIDAVLTTSDHLMGRYSITDNQETDPNQFPALGTQSLASRAQNVELEETHIFNQHWLNDARVSYYRDYFLFGAILGGTNFLQEAGIAGFEQTQIHPSFPYITLSGYSAFNGSGSGNFPKANRIQTRTYADTVTYSTGKHEIRFGAEVWGQHHSFANGAGQEGVFAFNGQYTGNAFADFLLGYPSQVTRSFPLNLYGEQATELAFFAQDTYHVLPTLTLEYGLRYERNPFFNGINGQQTGFDFSNGKIVVPMRHGQLLDPLAQPETQTLLPLYADRLEGTGTLGLPDSVRPTGTGQWAPRVGFAYHPASVHQMAVRGAFGLFPMFQDTLMVINLVKNPPFQLSQTVIDSTTSPSYTWANPFNGQPVVAPNPDPGTPCPGTTQAFATCVTPALSTAPTSWQHTYMEQYSLATQVQLLKDMSLTLTYLGSHTVHGQLMAVPENVPSPGPGTIQTRRPYPQWGTINMGLTNGTSNYNGLQAALEKRLSSGVYALASYAWSKCMDNGSDETPPPTIALLQQNYGVCSYDLTQNFTLSAIYQLPFGKGRHWLSKSNAWTDAAFGGWELAGIFSARSGLPYTPVIATDPANVGITGEWPNRIGNGSLAHPTVQHWFDTSAFTIPAAYTYGNSGRDILRSDGLVDLDMTLKKNFIFSESKFLELRLESFNVANHPTFAAPNDTIGSASAGEVTSTLNANRIFQAALKFIF